MVVFNVPGVDNASTVSTGAQDIRAAGQDVDQKMKETSNAWQPIRGQYDAPEEDHVHRAMMTPEEMVAELKSAADNVADGLDTYATELEALKKRRDDLLAEIKEFQREKAAADPNDEAAQTRLDLWEDELHRKCSQLKLDIQSADSRCANAIKGAAEGAGSSIGQTLVKAVTRGNNVEGALGGLIQVSRLGLDGVKYSSMAYFFQNGRVQLRQGWAPKLLQNIAGRGKFGAGLVKGLTKWDANAVSNPGQFLAKASPMNPMARPKGFVETLQTVAARSMLKLEGKTSRIPNAGHGGANGLWNKVGKISKIASRAGTALSFGTAAVDSWQQDSKTHPHMGAAEKSARAAVTGAGSAAGGWAGGKAGASVGAAIGSLAGPVGTVVGGVVGGIIGGVAGSKAGGWLADKVKNPIGSLFD